MVKGLSIVEILLVLYIMVGLLLAYPYYFTEKGLNRPGLWINTIVNSLFWPRFAYIFIRNLVEELSGFSTEEE